MPKIQIVPGSPKKVLWEGRTVDLEKSIIVFPNSAQVPTVGIGPVGCSHADAAEILRMIGQDDELDIKVEASARLESLYCLLAKATWVN